MMSSFSNPVIVLLMIHRKHSPTPTGLMPVSFFFRGTSLHARRVDVIVWDGMDNNYKINKISNSLTLHLFTVVSKSWLHKSRKAQAVSSYY